MFRTSQIFLTARFLSKGWPRRSLHLSALRRKKTAETELCRQLKARIRMNGPITVADYMREVLTNPVAGYYMYRDVFGSHGDFITSPEISQMFGEMLGVWCVNEWMQCGSPGRLQVVELGPGRGTLADDMLRVFSQFEGVRDAVSLHLVEVSPKLADMQADKLTNGQATRDASTEGEDDNTISYKQCRSKYGPDVRWYRKLRDVPHGFSFFIAHEFFDALPIHIFQKKDGGWQELLVDIDDSPEGEHQLRFVLSFGDTPASKLLLDVPGSDGRERVELSPETGVLVHEIARRISQHGGASLIADYGHTGDKSDTFRAFRQHQLHHPLCEPGTADLTADVDFTYMKNIVAQQVNSIGPVTQQEFLHNMGIGLRLQVLMGKCDAQQRENLITGYDMLTNPKKMGKRFKFLALVDKQRPEDYKPAGFIPP